MGYLPLAGILLDNLLHRKTLFEVSSRCHNYLRAIEILNFLYVSMHVSNRLTHLPLSMLVPRSLNYTGSRSQGCKAQWGGWRVSGGDDPIGELQFLIKQPHFLLLWISSTYSHSLDNSKVWPLKGKLQSKNKHIFNSHFQYEDLKFLFGFVLLRYQILTNSFSKWMNKLIVSLTQSQENIAQISIFFMLLEMPFYQPFQTLILLILNKIGVTLEEMKPQVWVINKGSNFIISVQFAFSGQKGWRLWNRVETKTHIRWSQHQRPKKAMLRECFELRLSNTGMS